jgi:hypothetical protein
VAASEVTCWQTTQKTCSHIFVLASELTLLQDRASVKTPVQLHEEVTEPHHIDFESESGDSSHFRSSNFSSPKYGASILVSNQTSKRRSSKIQFSTVEVRQYERVLGDNPGVSSGPPVSIGWKHFEDRTVVLPIDEYEYYHGACTEDQCEMILTRFERETMPLELGYTEKELVQSIRENYKVKNKRRQTVNNIPLMEIEESLEKAKRSLKKVIARKKSSKHMYEDWKKTENYPLDVNLSRAGEVAF